MLSYLFKVCMTQKKCVTNMYALTWYRKILVLCMSWPL